MTEELVNENQLKDDCTLLTMIMTTETQELSTSADGDGTRCNRALHIILKNENMVRLFKYNKLLYLNYEY